MQLGEDLRTSAWIFFIGLCLFAVGTIRSLAARTKKPYLLWLLLLPLGPLAYGAWLLIRALTAAVLTQWKEVVLLIWGFLTIYLWVRGNIYKEDAERAQQMLADEVAIRNKRPSERIESS